MSLIGAFFKFAYSLYRHRWLGWPLSHWLGLALLVGGTIASIRAWPSPWGAVVFGILFLAYGAALAWAARLGYVVFEAQQRSDDTGKSCAVEVTLRPEEMVPVRVSGLFTVQGKTRYFVDVDADFQTTALDEHIIMGRVRPSRYLLLGQWPEGELGWWYMFFRPEMIRQLAVGQLRFGLRSRNALRLILAASADGEQVVFLALPDRAQLARVQMHLLQGASRAGSQGSPENKGRDIPEAA